MNCKRTLIAALFALTASAPLYAANSLTYQGITFSTYAVDSDTLNFTITGANSATGNWLGINFLSAFEIKDIGNVTGASIFSGPTFSVSIDNGLSANLGCATGGTPGACFSKTPAFEIANSMAWVIDFTGTNLNFSAPHVKVQFLTGLSNNNAAGDLLSRTIPAIPEPETYAMLLAGLGIMASIARRKIQKDA